MYTIMPVEEITNACLDIYRTIRNDGYHSKVLEKYIKHPRTLFYMFLTSNDTNIKNRIMVSLNVRFHALYKTY